MSAGNDEQRGSDSVEVKTGFGTVRAGGTLAIVIIVELACTALLLWVMNDMKSSFTSALRESTEQTEAQTYVLTLTAEERTKLRLNMPRRLREQIYEERHR